MTKQTHVGDREIQMDRRRMTDRRNSNCDSLEPAASQLPTRRKQPRRRQIDPTTCEREYNDSEIEFMQAIDAYKRSSGRMFPTCSEILEVIQNLGYQRLSPEEVEMLKIAREIDSVSDELTGSQSL